MGEKKVTKMLIKVDLQCSKCYKKIKKVLCSFPQIRDQVFDEKANTVLITVLCCSPEKIKHKICCKGGDTIIGMEILPDKPKEPEPPMCFDGCGRPPYECQGGNRPKKPKVTFTEPPKEAPKPKPAEPKVTAEPPKEAAKPLSPAPKVPEPFFPVPGYPPPVNIKVGMSCCQPYYEGCGGGPCYCQGYGRPPPKCIDGCGRPPYECQGGNRQKKPKVTFTEPPKEDPKPIPDEPPKEPAKPKVTAEPPKEAAKPPSPAPKAPEPFFPVPGYPPPVNITVGMSCCQPYYEGCGGGPCYCQGYGRPPPMCFDGCGRPPNECQGGNRGYYVSRCDDYLSEENASGCSIM